MQCPLVNLSQSQSLEVQKSLKLGAKKVSTKSFLQKFLTQSMTTWVVRFRALPLSSCSVLWWALWPVGLLNFLRSKACAFLIETSRWGLTGLVCSYFQTKTTIKRYKKHTKPWIDIRNDVRPMISRRFRSGAPATPIWGKRFPEPLGIAAHYRRMDICVGTQDDMCEPWSSQWFSEGLFVARPPTSNVRYNNIRDLFQSLSMCLKDPSCAVAREYSVNKKTGRKLRRITQLLKEQDRNTSQYYTLKTCERIYSKFKGIIFQ